MREVTINGQWKLWLPDFRADQWEKWGYWERERMTALHADVQPGSIIYDIGAEEGDMSALYGAWTGTTGGVVLFEPKKLFWPNIRTVFELNRIPAPRGYYVGFASDLTDEAPGYKHDRMGMDDFPECAAGPPNQGVGFHHLAEESAVIPQITLDAFCAVTLVRPDIITIDVEGAELRVLKGMQTIMELFRPIVYVSVHREFMRDMYKCTPEDIFGFMGAQGYDATYLANDLPEAHYVFRPR
jgi:FkbM family methyltransferase